MPKSIPSRTITRKTNPLRPGNPVDITIDSVYEPEVVQYEFYIPAAIWDHSAVRDFIKNLGGLDPSATIFKGATGVWQGDQEDTHIYRLIRGPGAEKMPRQTVRNHLWNLVEEMMAKLSEWGESVQKAFFFTEAKISSTLVRKR